MGVEFIIIRLLALGIGVVFHEVAHGWVAEKLGDPTARMRGRVTLNPLVHIDPIGSVLLPMIMIFTGSPPIGWAKPVPVNFSALRNPKRDMILVAIAGAATNFILALIASLIMKTGLINPGSLLKLLLTQIVVINVILAVFNLVPIPPLDGSRIVMGLLPNDLAYKYMRLERIGFFIIIILFASGILFRVIWPVIAALLSIFGVAL